MSILWRVNIHVRCLTIVFLTVLLLSASSLMAAEIKGVRFTDSITIDQTEVSLRSTALLKWMGLIKVYAGAFYLPDDIAAENWGTDTAKSLELVYFRKIDAADFGKASDKLLKEAMDDKGYQEIADRLQTFYQLFRTVTPGDRYTLVYQPDAGTELRFNGEPLGRVAGEDFARAYFGIWLGTKPLDSGFRDQLLKAAG